jgi:L-asparaginase/Glu-tRNA(Gln) amidotransferase subunit D
MALGMHLLRIGSCFISKAINNGLHVVNVTQCSGGSVNMGQYETSTGLKAVGVISEKTLQQRPPLLN